MGAVEGRWGWSQGPRSAMRGGSGLSTHVPTGLCASDPDAEPQHLPLCGDAGGAVSRSRGVQLPSQHVQASLVAQTVKNLPAMRETRG